LIDLAFQITGAKPQANAAAPTLLFGLYIRSDVAVHSILLRCQIQIEPRRRKHTKDEMEKLTDVFGSADRWPDTLRPIVWNQSNVNVPGFEGGIEVDLPVACTYDFEITAAKYLAALESGELPLRFLFSGTVFLRAPAGFVVQQVPWNKEAVYRMPVEAWRNLMDLYFPDAAWIRVSRETLDRLQRVRAAQGMTSWDELLNEMFLVEKESRTCEHSDGRSH
jgi:hypothetical protein